MTLAIVYTQFFPFLISGKVSIADTINSIKVAKVLSLPPIIRIYHLMKTINTRYPLSSFPCARIQA